MTNNKKFYFVVILLVVTIFLLGCDKVKSDLGASANSLKNDFDSTTGEIKASITETKEFIGDVKSAAKEIKEAKDAVKNIGN
ncbi:hypothetical protein COV81_02725 [Candidatus Peregrinibacteria bacterium CG11_big_fil_rev_8_21_14_0_20_41_10]|nr:MAG: hypothetical protein COV81_02725 [Candidatus Peregrinibacteria bacterium CG11_big_fil_rev_8_21_14_0_20_41_10]PIZ76570.1 MAG: hypothetical protein COY06_01730 [Candidatus Peregrinibacteria bacterium CG_4_10_14_0_2_um_filter_41_8]PJC37656.1 MAG: hypothetical protein CO045_04140 [Candidatus Peregrinibacteria bacterium CG_4_9_14_0_2_um_filter_41_14]